MPNKKTKDYDYFVNVLVVGDEAAGKSQVVSRFISDSFNKSHDSTIGVNLNFKKVKENDKQVQVYVREAGGKPNFKPLIPSFAPDSNILILACDLSKEDGLSKAADYLEILRKSQENTKLNPPSKIILVGTKSDLADKEAIVKFNKFAQEQNLDPIVTNAKTGEGVNEVFARAIKLSIDNKLTREHNKATQDDRLRRKELKDALLAHNVRIELNQRKNAVNFTQGFTLFKKIRGQHREVNYLLAKELIKQLDDTSKSIAEIFSDKNLKSLMKSSGKINSSDLKYIIKVARNPEIKMDLTRLKQPEPEKIRRRF